MTIQGLAKAFGAPVYGVFGDRISKALYRLECEYIVWKQNNHVTKDSTKRQTTQTISKDWMQNNIY